MILRFKEGTPFHKTVGENLVGIRKNNRRPCSIELNRDELIAILDDHRDKIHDIRTAYLYRLIGALETPIPSSNLPLS